MTIRERRALLEEALIRWRAERQDEWRRIYYFDCGDLGIVKLFWIRHNWECRWLDIETCPVKVAE